MGFYQRSSGIFPLKTQIGYRIIKVQYPILTQKGVLKMTFLSPNDPRFQADSDAVSIQNAINAAEEGDIRTVCIPRICARTGKPEWIIDKSILLPSNITVLLDDCHLILKAGVYENIFRNKNLYTDIDIKPEGKQSGIRIIGMGDAILDGGEGNDLTEATSLKDGRPSIRFNNFILLHNVDNYVIENISCVNMRWWAINQICCTHGRLENIRFFNGKFIANQDGIDFRIGCSNIYVNNITGRCGDDVIALSAFAGTKERERFLVEGMEPDIHDMTITNVCAHTHYALVAMRNTDGAKIYRIFIENIRDSGGEYGPFCCVRIGENLYYRDRTSILGETYDIHVKGVYSMTLCTVMLGGALKDSHISDVYANGSSMSAISTYSLNKYLERQKKIAWGGATLENVVFDNIHYNGTAGHCDKEWMNEPGTPYSGCALDFRRMREEDFFKNVVFRDIFAREGAELCIACDKIKPDIRN